MPDTNRIYASGSAYGSACRGDFHKYDELFIADGSPRHRVGWTRSFDEFADHGRDDLNVWSMTVTTGKGHGVLGTTVGKYSKRAVHVHRRRPGVADGVVLLTQADYNQLVSRISALELLAVGHPAVTRAPTQPSLSNATIGDLCETARRLFGNAELQTEADEEGIQRTVVRVSVADDVEPAEASNRASAWYQRLVEIEPDAKPGSITLSIQFS